MGQQQNNRRKGVRSPGDYGCSVVGAGVVLVLLLRFGSAAAQVAVCSVLAGFKGPYTGVDHPGDNIYVTPSRDAVSGCITRPDCLGMDNNGRLPTGAREVHVPEGRRAFNSGIIRKPSLHQLGAGVANSPRGGLNRHTPLQESKPTQRTDGDHTVGSAGINHCLNRRGIAVGIRH
ncbi:hypothetical protein PLESTM_000783400 [Pleodorina starrii]|nr:hypothetical protein PLESTM_000783400 [Pleodorina starrii]